MVIRRASKIKLTNLLSVHRIVFHENSSGLPEILSSMGGIERVVKEVAGRLKMK